MQRDQTEVGFILISYDFFVCLFASDGNCRQPAQNVREDNPPAVRRKHRPYERKPKSGRET